eukprot:1152288-Pelagomonas_calceolata.AAC.4
MPSSWPMLPASKAGTLFPFFSAQKTGKAGQATLEGRLDTRKAGCLAGCLQGHACKFHSSCQDAFE